MQGWLDNRDRRRRRCVKGRRRRRHVRTLWKHPKSRGQDGGDAIEAISMGTCMPTSWPLCLCGSFRVLLLPLPPGGCQAVVPMVSLKVLGVTNEEVDIRAGNWEESLQRCFGSYIVSLSAR